jgi:hypothetical protein
MDTSTIKSYLISLGFEADDNMYRKFSAALSKASSEVEKHTSIMANSYVKAGGVIIGAVGTIIASTTMLLDSLAKADLGYEKYAMRMYMARDAAKQFKIVTDAMGESLEDIAWIPELNERYRALMTETSKMKLPSSYEDQMRMIRDIKFEFTRLKIESTYGLQWIGYNIIKNLYDPLGKTKLSFSDFNDYIRDNMPRLAKEIADDITMILQPLQSCWELIKDLTSSLGDLWDQMSDTERIVAFGAAIAAVFYVSGPVGRAIMIIGALTIAIDDFYGAMKGKETMLPIEAWWGFVAVADSLGRMLMTVALALKTINNLVGIGGETIGKWVTGAVAGITGDEGAKKAYKKLSESKEKRWNQVKYDVKEIGAVWEAGGDYGVLGKMPNDFYMSNEDRKKRSVSMNLAESDLQNIEQYKEAVKSAFGKDAPTMMRVAQAESGWDKTATNKNKNKSQDYGLFQINDKAWGDRLKKEGIIKETNDLLDPATNIKAAQYVLQQQGLSAWESSRIQSSGGGWGQGQSQQGDIHIENVNLNNYKANEAGRAGNDFVTTVRACVAKGTCAN